MRDVRLGGFRLPCRLDRLQDDGACFRDISSAVRKTCAQALIAEGRLSIKEIAQELGFSDMSSFSQAYKRWTGVAPSVSRQAAGL